MESRDTTDSFPSHNCRRVGSNRSRNQSPARLNPSTVIAMVPPAIRATWGKRRSTALPWSPVDEDHLAFDKNPDMGGG